ncbi:MAG: formylglycine-generating enzyme family protein [Thermodesulfobacteriota bacterium]
MAEVEDIVTPMVVYSRPRRTFVMVRIPAGEFTMGSAVGHGDVDEFPPRQVFLDEYLIGRHPVTAAEWVRFLNALPEYDPRYFEPSRETTVFWMDGRFLPRKGCARHPANGVTWFGAEAYCRWLSDQTEREYRLPTEAEWEKACRGGLEGRRYPWGNEPATGMAQYEQTWVDPKHTLSPVGAYPPNPYGLHDLVGNVWEWCQDWYDRNYYQRSPQANPTGPENGEFKVLRGGSWGCLDVQIRCGIRVGERPDVSESRVGFRLARRP